MSNRNPCRCLVIAACLACCAGAAEGSQGSIIGWGSQVVGVDLTHGFVAVAAGWGHSLGLKADGSIAAWGDNWNGQCNVPSPNIGVAAGAAHSLSLKDLEMVSGRWTLPGWSVSVTSPAGQPHQ